MQRRNFLGLSLATSSALLLSACGSNNNDTSTRNMILRKIDANENSEVESIYRIDANPLVLDYDGIVGDSEQEQSIIDQSITESENFKLRIFHINDMHNHTVDLSTSKGDTNRLAQVSKRYKDAVASAQNNEIVLFVTAGDDHTGNVLDELRGFDESSFIVDSSYEMYSALGATVVTMGNHELDKGAQLLKKSVQTSAKMPLISANVIGSKYLTKDDYSPAVVALSKGLRVGFIGLTTPSETATMTEEDPNRIVSNPELALKAMIPQVERCSDVIVILSHLGYGGNDGQIRHDAEVADIDIAKVAATLTTKPVMIIGGHSHTVLNSDGLDKANVIDGVLIAQAGGNGSHVGEIVASINKSSTQTALTYDSVNLHSIKKRDDRDGKFVEGVNEVDEDIDMDFKINVTDPILAQLSSKLTEEIASVDFNDSMSTATTYKDRYVGECAIANFMNDAIVAQSKKFPGNEEADAIDIAAFNASGISSGVEDQANITFQDWYGVMPYADSIYLTTMTGKQIKSLIESNVTRLLLPSEDKLNGGTFSTSGYISWGFLHFSKALTYSVNYNEEQRSVNASNIKINGITVENQLNTTFRVSFSSYIGSGFEYWNGESIGANHPGNSIGYDLTQFTMQKTGLIYRNEIISYIVSKGIVGESTGMKKDGRIKFI